VSARIPKLWNQKVTALGSGKLGILVASGQMEGGTTMLLERLRKPQDKQLNLLALIRRDGKEPALAKVTRIWYEGCEFASEVRLSPDDVVGIEIGGMGSIRARIIHAAGGRAEARFIEDSPA